MASGSPEPNVNIVLFNTDSSDEDKDPAPDRLECMDPILNSILAKKYPILFILAQDKINKHKHKKLCERMHQDSTSVRLRNEAGVYYDTKTTTHYDVEYVDVAELQRASETLIYEARNVFTVARLTACVLTPKAGFTTGKILLASWHGPCKVNRKQRGETNPQEQDPETARRRCFARLVRFLERLKGRKGCDMVIVGGDFNLPAGKARQELDQIEVNGEVSASYTPTEDRPNGDPIDYVVYWPRDCLQLTSPVSVVMPDFRRVRYNRPFDHNILLYRLEDIKPFSDLARQFGCITVYEDEE